MEFILNIPLPPQRELLSVAKLRELKRLFQIIKTPSVIFLRKNDSPLKDGAEAQIEFDVEFGQGRALSLRYDIEFNLIAADNRHISVNYYGGSKPPPYRVGYIFSIRAKHPLLFTFLSSLFSLLFSLLSSLFSLLCPSIRLSHNL